MHLFLFSRLLMLRLLMVFLPLFAVWCSAVRAGQFDIEGPPGGKGFGYGVTVLPNGNIVVTDPSFIVPPVSGAGAVHLYSPAGVLISTLTGSRSNDRVGSGGVKVLTNGNFVVISHEWNGTRGAVTWMHRDTGLNGVVSAENSLTGMQSGDLVGEPAGEGTASGVTALSNGNYVVRSRNWSNGAKPRAGAVTWGNGATGTVGIISAANSLVGTTFNDQVGEVTALRNGDYVVTCPRWSNGWAASAGAAVWCDGDTGRSGPVSTENALFGAAGQSRVGGGDPRRGGPVVELVNGNFVVVSPQWNDGTGAVTWCPAGGGLTGPVSEANSLTGSSPGDGAGGGGGETAGGLLTNGGVTALSDGNYAVASPLWNKPGAEDAGAVTWGNGATGATGKITAANSLTGAAPGDCIGSGGVAALLNGHYAVCSPLWNRLSEFGSGAVTRVSGGGPFSGTVSVENSLTGTGREAYLTVLTNGNYVVCSPLWHNGAAFRAGAVTWCDGSAGLVGTVSAANSLVGTLEDDRVGAVTMEGSTKISGVVALGNGNYVVRSAFWNKGDIPAAGAVTWCSGATGRTGPVTAANSLTGSTAEDCVGGATLQGAQGGRVTALSDGNYVVSSPYWDKEGVANTGAVTWCDGVSGRTGVINAENSLVGSKPEDLVGREGVETLNGGNYVIVSRNWDNGELQNAGAVTLGKSGGITGLINLTNSVCGTVHPTGQPPVWGADASGGLIAAGRLRINTVTVFSYNFQDMPELIVEQPQTVERASGEAADFGASAAAGGSAGMQFIIRNKGYAPLSLSAELLNNPAFSLATGRSVEVPPRESAPLLILFKPSAAGTQSGLLRLTTNDPDRQVFEISLNGAGVTDSPAVSSDLPGPSGSGQFGHSVTVLPNGNVVVTDPFFDLPGPVKDAGAVYLFDASGALVSTLTGSSANDRAGSGGVTVLTNGNFVIRSPYWSSGAAVNAGAITWVSGAAGVSGVISAENSLVGSTKEDFLGDEFLHYTSIPSGAVVKNIPHGVTALPGGNYVVCSPHWDAGPAAANAGAVTWGNGAAGARGVVSSENSLTGSFAGDLAGGGGVTLLSNGNYVTGSPAWNAGRGAVTWGAGNAGARGVISAENSLTGTAEFDSVGLKRDATGLGASGVAALTSGHYVVSSSFALNRAGAVTWCDGFTGARGLVTTANSLTGSTEGDFLGAGGVVALSGGGYVVSSPNWTKVNLQNAGAVTWCSGSAGLTGPVTEENSLTGSTSGDYAGSGGVTETTDGRYAVSSPFWNSGNNSNLGAVTWGDGVTGLKGVVISAENSLTGSVQSDAVGSGGVTALPGGACVISSPSWNGNRGAVTWCAPGAGAGMTVHSGNSLTGEIPDERIGYPGVTVLGSGNYVIASSGWSTGGFPNVGAVTWCRGDVPLSGKISALNSLTGAKQEDRIGGVTTNGLTYGGVTVLSNGNWLTAGYLWDNGAARDAGAVTWGDGLHGIRGGVSAGNSLTGGNLFDHTGEKITVFGGGYYAVSSPGRRNGNANGAGAVTFARGDGPPPAAITSGNSVLGATPGMGGFLNTAFRESDAIFITGRPGDNLVTFFQYRSGADPQISVSRQDQSGGGIGNFGEVEIGKSAALEFTVTNTGAAPAAFERVIVSGPGFTAAAPALTGRALAPGESAVFSVAFTPASEGAQSAELYLSASRPPGSPLSRLALTGTGKAAPGSGAPFGEGGGDPKAERQADGRLNLSFKALPGAGYLLQRSTDLQAWTEAAPVTADAEGNILWIDVNPPAGKVFYRLKVP